MQEKADKNAVQEKCHVLLPMSTQATSKLKEKVISTMSPDEITLSAKNDDMIIELGTYFYSTIELTSHNYSYVSAKMREAARLLLVARKINPEIVQMQDCIQPRLFRDVVRAVKTVAGCDDETGPTKLHP